MPIYLPRDFMKIGPPVRADGTTAATFAAGDDARITGAAASTDPRFMTYTEQFGGRSGGPQGPLGSGTILLISDTAYFVCFGRAVASFVPAYIKCYMGTVGSSTQVAEIGYATIPLWPNGSGQTFTKLEATGTITSLTAGVTVVRNTSAFTTQVTAGAIWGAMIRTAMAGNQPTMNALNRDYARANVLTKATAGALTSGSSWVGAAIAASASTAEAPTMWWSLDP